MRVLVTGGRAYDDRAAAYEILDEIHALTPIAVLVHGDARGLDRIARDWARARNVQDEAHPADWKLHPRAAGPIRNKQMVELGADLVLVFPGGVGTKHCAKSATARGLRVESACPELGQWWRDPEPAQASFDL